MDYLGIKIVLTILKSIGAGMLYFIYMGKRDMDYFLKEKESLSILVGFLAMMAGLSLFWMYAL